MQPNMTPALIDTESCLGGPSQLHSNTKAQNAHFEIIDSMEQGVLVWSKNAVCEIYNQRVFDLLELSPKNLYLGMSRSDFMRMAVERGVFTEKITQITEHRFRQLAPFSYDLHMPSGSVIACNTRPKKSGGFVVTFTDVTETRRKEIELEAQREKFHDAQIEANAALSLEREGKVEARKLSQLGEWLQSCKSLDELLLIVSSFLGKLIQGSAGELYIYNNSRDMLDSACSWGIDTPAAHIQPDDCWALRRGRLYKFGEGLVDFSCNHVNGEISDCYNGHYLCLPIIAHGDTVGLLHVRFNKCDEVPNEPGHPIPIKLVLFVIRCTEQISLAIANVKLRDELRGQSIKDPLTGLFNRRYFLDRVGREISDADLQNRPLGLISLGLDHFRNYDDFKVFNETHGHDAGDLVLRSISEVMLDNVNDGDVVARFGGEEFSILMPNKTPSECYDMAETLRTRVEASVLRYGGVVLPKTTISIGVASFPQCARSQQDLLAKADRALFLAKDGGRNRVVVAEGSDF